MLKVRSQEFYFSALIFVVLTVTYSYFIPGSIGDAVTQARVALTRSIVDRGVFDVDPYQKELFDLAFFEKHYYIPHSPGPSFVGIPGYLTWKLVSAIPVVPDSQKVAEYISYGLVIIFAATLPSVLLHILFFQMVSRLTARRRFAFILTMALALGSMSLPYSSRLFQHQLASFCIFGGFYLTWRVVYQRASPWWLLASGMLFGLGVISEYTAIIIVGLILAWAFFSLPRPLLLYRTLLGGTPFGILLALYNYQIFHNPFTFAYEYHLQWGNAVHSHGLGGITDPSLNVLMELMFGSFRGLFFLSPFLLSAAPGLFMMWRRRPDQRSVVILFCLIICSYFFYNSAYLIWWGGYSVGPRFLTIILPFMAVPIVFVMDSWFTKKIGSIVLVALISLSILNVWIQSLASLPPDVSGAAEQEDDSVEYGYWVLDQVDQGNIVRNPLFDHSLPQLTSGKWNANIGTLIGLSGGLSLVPLFLFYLVTVVVVYRLGILKDQNLSDPTLPDKFLPV